jgi:hypothetical protein
MYQYSYAVSILATVCNDGPLQSVISCDVIPAAEVQQECCISWVAESCHVVIR